MNRQQAIKKVMKFITEDDRLGFGKRLVLMRGMNEVKSGAANVGDELEIVLLRLRYGVPQGIPLGWTEIVTVPREIDMAGDLVDKPVGRGYIIRGESYKRPGRTLKVIDKVEKEEALGPVGVKLVRL